MVASGAADGLAVDRDRTSSALVRAVTVSQPRADHAREGLGVQAGKGPADRGLGRDRPAAGERIAVRAERGTDLLVCVSGPFGDRGDRACTSQHCAGGDGEDGDQRMPTPGAGSRVTDGCEVGEQVGCFGCSDRISVGQDAQAPRDRG
jgi:hypothetical protein